MARRLIGSGKTDSNGKVTVPFEGKGLGKLQIVAECGSLLSETYELLDATFIDYGITGKKNDNWNNHNNRLTVQTDTEGTLLTGNESGNGFYFVNGSNPVIFDDYSCEFDIIGIPVGARVYHENTTSNENSFIFNTGWFNDGENHVEISVQDGISTFKVNGTERGTRDLTVNGPYKVAFRLNTGTSNNLKFKNFIIYPI